MDTMFIVNIHIVCHDPAQSKFEEYNFPCQSTSSSGSSIVDHRSVQPVDPTLIS